jgi:hypothetical protein
MMLSDVYVGLRLQIAKPVNTALVPLKVDPEQGLIFLKALTYDVNIFSLEIIEREI